MTQNPEQSTMVPADRRANALVATERERQDRMWGGADHDAPHDCLNWTDILGRQYQHVIESCTYGNARDRTTELVQMLAVGHAWLEAELRQRDRLEGGR